MNDTGDPTRTATAQQSTTLVEGLHMPPRFGPDTWQGRALARHYTGKPGWIDGTTLFHRYMLDRAAAAPGADATRRDILELGPGILNRTTRLLRQRFGRVDGLDVDADAASNTDLTRFFHYRGGAWPTPDSEYDAVVADFVFEHVEDPRSAFAEARRSLRPGGVLILRTPNLWHYISLVSALTPHWFHTSTSGRLRRYKEEAHDVYPTFYRANTAPAIRRAARTAGLEVADITRIEKEPAYGMASPLLFYPFMLYERLVNLSPIFSFGRSTIFATLRKPADRP